jgi:hypothetical protein
MLVLTLSVNMLGLLQNAASILTKSTGGVAFIRIVDKYIFDCNALLCRMMTRMNKEWVA